MLRNLLSRCYIQTYLAFTSFVCIKSKNNNNLPSCTTHVISKCSLSTTLPTEDYKLEDENWASNYLNPKSNLSLNMNETFALHEELDNLTCELEQTKLLHTEAEESITHKERFYEDAVNSQDKNYITGLELEIPVNQIPELDYDEDEHLINSSHNNNRNGIEANENFWWLRERVLVNNIPQRIPPLRVPNKDGEVETTENEQLELEEEEKEESSEIPRCKTVNKQSYITQQDLLYLSYPTPPEVQLPSLVLSSSSSSYFAETLHSQHEVPWHSCVMVVFTANDLRIHDNYALAMASSYVQELISKTFNNNSSNDSINVGIIGVCVIDYRTFAQPSRIGGFYRQGPEKARFLLSSIASLREKLERELHVPLIIRCGRPEEHIPRLAMELNTLAVFMSTQYFPHERRVQELTVKRLHEHLWISKHVPASHKELTCTSGSETSSSMLLLEKGQEEEQQQEFEQEQCTSTTRQHRELSNNSETKNNNSNNNNNNNNNVNNKTKETEPLHEFNLASCNENNLQEPLVLATREHVNEHPYGVECLYYLVSNTTNINIKNNNNNNIHINSSTNHHHHPINNNNNNSKNKKQNERRLGQGRSKGTVNDTYSSWLQWRFIHPLHVHSVWQSTLIHIDDLPTPIHRMPHGERWYHDDVNVANIRPTSAYDAQIARITSFPCYTSSSSSSSSSQLLSKNAIISCLLPSFLEGQGAEPPSLLRGRIPTLEELGYGHVHEWFSFSEVIGTSQNHFAIGEDAAISRVSEWMNQGGFTSLLRYGRERRTNMKMYSIHLSKLSPYVAHGILSPRKLYELMRLFAQEMSKDGFAQMQFREALLRLSRRDYWHWHGLRCGDSLFYPYGPSPLETDSIPPWRHDRAIIQKWCLGLTGIPFADAAMKELRSTGFVGFEGRKALAWLLCVGYNQDWRIGAEWFARNLLDYDPLVCFGNFAYYTNLIKDDFGERVHDVHYIAHQHDQTGIYVKKWLPILSKIPPVYIHRPHVLSPRMQAMHNVYLGQNYPYPIKLWDGAQNELGPLHLTCYVGNSLQVNGPGYAEAFRHGLSILDPAEWEAFTQPVPIDIEEEQEEKEEQEELTSNNEEKEVKTIKTASSWMDLYLPSSAFNDANKTSYDNQDAKEQLVCVKPSNSIIRSSKNNTFNSSSNSSSDKQLLTSSTLAANVTESRSVIVT